MLDRARTDDRRGNARALEQPVERCLDRRLTTSSATAKSASSTFQVCSLLYALQVSLQPCSSAISIAFPSAVRSCRARTYRSTSLHASRSKELPPVPPDGKPAEFPTRSHVRTDYPAAARNRTAPSPFAGLDRPPSEVANLQRCWRRCNGPCRSVQGC